MDRTIPGVVLQSEVNECGLACIAMFAETQGVDVSLAELRERYTISDHGTSLANLGNILTDLSIVTYPVMFSHEELDALPLPAILHYGAGHFVLLAYRKGKHVCVINPAIGQQFLSFDALKMEISGYALVLDEDVSIDVEKKRKNNSTARNTICSTLSLKQTAKIKGIYKLMLLSLFVSLTLFIMPFMVSQSINEVFSSAGQVDFPYALFLLAFVCSTGLALFARIITEKYIKKFVVLNSAAGFARLMSNPLRFFERHALGDVFSRFSAWENAAAQKIELDNGLRSDWVIALIAMGIMAWMSPILTLVSFVGVIAMGAVSVWAVYRDRYYTQQLQVQTAEQSEFILESLHGFTTLKSAGLMEYRKGIFARYTRSLFSCIQKKHIYEQAKNSIYQMIGSLEMVFFMLLALPLLKEGTLSLGDFFAYSFIRQIFSNYITKIFYSIIQKNQLQVIDKRAEDLFPLRSDKTCEGAASRIPVGDFSHKLSYDDIVFSYDSEKVAIDHLSLSVDRGQVLGIVGESGAGKSTLIKVIAGLLIPQEGEIRVDGRPVSSEQVGELVFLQSQEDILFSASVLENITLFDPSVDESKIPAVEALLSSLNLLDMIEQLPGGIHARIRESHTGLSLGQRQRLLLARAMYSQRPVMIFDEPTANLDEANALQVMNAVINHARLQGKTLIVVTHSKAILPMFDRAIAIHHGHVTPLPSLPHQDKQIPVQAEFCV